MAEFKTPSKSVKPTSDIINVPASPFLKRLGYGTGVSVYRLQRSPLCSKVRSPWALKKLNENKKGERQIAQRLLDEAAVLRKLSHPNVIGFRALTKDVNGRACLLMEECNCSVRDMIDDRFEEGLEGFPAENILKVAFDIAKALEYLHDEVLILHGDVKSDNVLVKGNFEICKLCDFGVSLQLKPNGDAVTEDNEYVGTLAWIAPEVLISQIVSVKADVYSYGLVLWEMLALSPPPLPDLDDSMAEVSRPELPLQDFGDDYNYVLELFHCCTEEEPLRRPKASDLVVIVGEMLKCSHDI